MVAPIKIDSHLHLYPSAEIGLKEKQSEIWEYGGEPKHSSDSAGTINELLAQMERAGISKGVLLIYTRARELKDKAIAGLPRALGRRERNNIIKDISAKILAELEWNNIWGCRISSEYPQLSTFVTVDFSVQSPEQSAAHVLALVENHGAKGVKLHTGLQQFLMSDERLWPLFSICQDYKIPVLGHGGPDRAGHGYCEPKSFMPMLKAFPHLTVVMAHMGGASWRQTADVAEQCPNLCFDCSEIIEWTDTPNGPTRAELARLIRTVGSERVMMGSDFPWYDLDATVENVMDLPGLSRAEKEAIVGSNAINLLNL